MTVCSTSNSLRACYEFTILIKFLSFCKVVELPYGGDHEFAMYIIFPNTEGGWRDVEQKLAESTSFSFVDDLRYGDVLLSMPKWDLETDLADVTRILEELGLGHLFNGAPDFSAMIEGGSFSLSEVIHKAKIKVHEEVSVPCLLCCCHCYTFFLGFLTIKGSLVAYFQSTKCINQ